MGLGRHPLHAAEIGGGHDARNDGNGDAGAGSIVAKARDRVIVEAELTQRPAGPASIFASEFDVMAMAGRIRMAFGIKGDTDFKGRDAADAGDQFRRR
jgi:hypothetical protein